MSETQKRKIGLAVGSMICGLFFWFPLLGIICSIVALVLGIVALVKVGNNADMYGGKGMAISGIVLGGVGIILMPIIALLAAIAIPNLLRARLAANEAATQDTLKRVIVACESYKTANGTYPQNAEDLSNTSPIYIESSIFSSNGKFGYNFEYSSYNKDKYNLSAKPSMEGSSGIGYFAADESGRLYSDVDKNGIAGTGEDELIE